MALTKLVNYSLDRFGVFRAPGGEVDYCSLPCAIYTEAGNFLCKTRDNVEAAVRQHCSAAGIFDPEPIVSWAMETEENVVNPAMIRPGGPHTGVDDGWLALEKLSFYFLCPRVIKMRFLEINDKTECGLGNCVQAKF